MKQALWSGGKQNGKRDCVVKYSKGCRNNLFRAPPKAPENNVMEG